MTRVMACLVGLWTVAAVTPTVYAQASGSPVPERGRWFADVGLFGAGDTTQAITATGEPAYRDTLGTPGLHVGLGVALTSRVRVHVEGQWPAWQTYDYSWTLLDCGARECIERVVDRRTAGRTPAATALVAWHRPAGRRVRLGLLLGGGGVQRQLNLWNTRPGDARSSTPTLADRETTFAVSYGAEAELRVAQALAVVAQIRGHVPFGLGDEGLALSRGRILRPGLAGRWRF